MLSLSLFTRLRKTSTSVVSLELLESLCQREVYHYALRRLSRTQDAEDVAAEVYVAALETRWHPNLEARPWLLGIARRKVVDRLRLRQRRPETPLQQAHELLCTTASPEVDALRAEAIATIRALVLALPELQREALLLQTAEELSVKEIAQVMGKSPSAVNSLLGRARETLRLKGGPYFQEELS